MNRSIQWMDEEMSQFRIGEVGSTWFSSTELNIYLKNNSYKIELHMRAPKPKPNPTEPSQPTHVRVVLESKLSPYASSVLKKLAMPLRIQIL